MKFYAVLTLFAICYYVSAAKLDKELPEPKKQLERSQNDTATNKIMARGRQEVAGKKYLLTSTKSSWNNARKACLQMGGHLAPIQDYNAAVELRKAFLTNNIRSVWIGWHDRFSYRQYRLFVTVLGQDIDDRDQFWAPDEPNNADGRENCVELTLTGLNDNACYREFNAICEV